MRTFRDRRHVTGWQDGSMGKNTANKPEFVPQIPWMKLDVVKPMGQLVYNRRKKRKTFLNK